MPFIFTLYSDEITIPWLQGDSILNRELKEENETIENKRKREILEEEEEEEDCIVVQIAYKVLVTMCVNHNCDF